MTGRARCTVWPMVGQSSNSCPACEAPVVVEEATVVRCPRCRTEMYLTMAGDVKSLPTPEGAEDVCRCGDIGDFEIDGEWWCSAGSTAELDRMDEEELAQRPVTAYQLENGNLLVPVPTDRADEGLGGYVRVEATPHSALYEEWEAGALQREERPSVEANIGGGPHGPWYSIRSTGESVVWIGIEGCATTATDLDPGPGPDGWAQFWAAADEAGVWVWEDRYEAPDVLDGGPTGPRRHFRRIQRLPAGFRGAPAGIGTAHPEGHGNQGGVIGYDVRMEDQDLHDF